ncbi:transcriptional regulator GcvA [Ramlibacter sp.]|uniref:transcriptional regulator GcvA n=1 Tax=Ramlibacter sp. TaxID=1917967 RepID=UPI002C5B4893|nr:transcriptional regulator GcvA [Ramlibacter sp.]HWI82125.1 transcriptional regulator GcvA [Ramlibacter sp.]
MRRRIPPLNPLRVFETVARTENLTAAAHELHVTQSAVSRQIAVLESYLGVELLRRERHGVSLTRAGRQFAAQVGPAFDAIAGATEQLLKDTGQGALRLRTYTTFAAKWLIPRLADFHARSPDIEVRITTAVPEVDFDRDPVDMAIQFGDGRWPNVHADLLFEDQFEPVCSPAFLAEHAPDRRHPESLLRQCLLESHYRRKDWDEWLAAAGLREMAAESQRMSFNSSVLALQAAVSGLGIAIGQPRLLDAEFQAGQLVRPFARTRWKPIHRERAYYLLRPQHQRETRKTRLFRDWLLETVQQLPPLQD